MSQPLAPSVAETHRADRASHSVRLLGHDLRAALTDVVDGLRLIDPADLPEPSRAQLDRARSAGATLARLLDAALEPPAPPASLAPSLPPADLDFHRFLHEVEQRWRGRAEGHGLRFRARIGGDVPPRIRCDQTRLDRILSNLLGNAIKFTKAGGVELRADLRGGDELRLTVADTGPGFSDTALRDVFSRTLRPGHSTRDGSGLGLHIARSLATTLGGQVQACNGPDSGAEVSLLLPQAAWMPAGPGPRASALPDLTGKRILLAEDNDTNQLLVRQMLATLGASVTLAGDGVEALKLCADEDPDLALIDIEMPRIDGLELMRRLRSRAGTSAALPMLALTAYVQPDDRRKIYDAGADGIISKPIMDIAQFGQTLASLLMQPAQSPRAPRRSGRLAQLLALTGDALAPELLHRLLADLETARTGLTSAVASGDLSGVVRHAHVVVSLAATLGETQAEIRARAIEAAARQGHVHALTAEWAQLARILDRLRATLAAEAASLRETP